MNELIEKDPGIRHKVGAVIKLFFFLAQLS